VPDYSDPENDYWVQRDMGVRLADYDTNPRIGIEYQPLRPPWSPEDGRRGSGTDSMSQPPHIQIYPHRYQVLPVRCPRCDAVLFHVMSPRTVEAAARLFQREPEEFLRWLCQSKKRLDTPPEDTPLELCSGP